MHRIDEQLAKAMDRKVWLPSGGTLVIDRTEAMTVVDVNTGKFTGAGGNLEQTVTKNNLEAAEEIVRQLRLRDIGGIVVIDFIDMVLESNRDLVLRRLTEALARDRTRHQVSEVTSLGLVQLTRKRLGTGLIEAFSTTCPHCAGRGIVLHADPVDTGPGRPARKSESGGRRSRRGQQGAKARGAGGRRGVPAHAPGEHPMFKAMAAAKGDDDEDEESDEIVRGVRAPRNRRGCRGHGRRDSTSTKTMTPSRTTRTTTTRTTRTTTTRTTRTNSTRSTTTLLSDLEKTTTIEIIDEDAEVERRLTNRSAPRQPEAGAPARRPRRRAAARPAGPPVLDH